MLWAANEVPDGEANGERSREGEECASKEQPWPSYRASHGEQTHHDEHRSEQEQRESDGHAHSQPDGITHRYTVPVMPSVEQPRSSDALRQLCVHAFSVHERSAHD
jgi:hypothetical protein